MEELKKALAAADDDYLVGISNKGIVKRAYKDLEAAAVTSGFIDTTADITIDNAQCVIRVPLVKSECSCPSHTICRHIVTAILWLRREYVSSDTAAADDDAASPAATAAPTDTPAVVPEQAAAEPAVSALDSDSPPPPTATKQSRLAEELSAVPIDKLCKAMKKQYYASFLEKAKRGILPQMEESSVITVDILEDNVTVKLLSPLSYAACTCHSKELCKHKAAAILTWQLKHGCITLDSLAPPEEKAVVTDTEKLRRCLAQCTDFLTQLFSDGLVRTSHEAHETCESLAVVCHSANFPEGERLWRELGRRLSAYTAHSPEFDTDRLFAHMMRVYRLLTDLQQETDPQRLQALAGTFRDSYHVTDAMTLLPLAQRPFSSMTGYQGTVYYFLNKSDSRTTLPYVTFSDIRPTFYENGRQSSKSNAPWGLYGLCNVLMQSELRLLLPKVSGIRLSSSNETKAMQLGRPNLNQSAVYDSIYTDFRRLIEDNFLHRQDHEDSETLVMLLPERCIDSSFSEVTQTHTITIEDAYGQRLAVQARYNSKTQVFFEQLGAVGQQMLQHPEKSYVIFGNAYIEDGACHIYPIAVYDTIQPPRPVITEDADEQRQGDPSCRYFLSLFRELREQLCDMIQCGISAFDLYASIRDSAEECERSGLPVLSGLLRQLSEALSAQQHTYHSDNTPVIHLLGRIDNYLQTGIRQTETGCAIDHLYSHEREDEEP